MSFSVRLCAAQRVSLSGYMDIFGHSKKGCASRESIGTLIIKPSLTEKDSKRHVVMGSKNRLCFRRRTPQPNIIV